MSDKVDFGTVLVTGGTGSIGKHIVNRLLETDSQRIIIFNRDEIKHFLMKGEISDPRVEFFLGDVRNYRQVERVFQRYSIDSVFHAAAMKHVVVSERFPLECVQTNIIGTSNLVTIAKRNGIKKLITISTDKATSPSNVMGATKFIAEKITLNENYTCVRFGNVANSRGSVIPILIDNLLKHKPLNITDPNVTRFIIEIPEAASLVLKAAQHSQGGDIFILKMSAMRLKDLVDVVVDDIAPLLGIGANDITVKYTGLTTGEKIDEDLINITEIDRVYELSNMYVILNDNNRASDYDGLQKTALLDYSSQKVQTVAKTEIKRLVKNHLMDLKLIEE
jgi:UDP-N-acetylglucosamine 4,6-dehydratase